jgi:hypothetical protein
MADLLEWANASRFSGSVVVRASRTGTIHFTNGFVSLVSIDKQPESLGDSSDNREIRMRLARRLALLLHGYTGDVDVDPHSRIPTEARLLFVGTNLLEIAMEHEPPAPTEEVVTEPDPDPEPQPQVKVPRLRTGLHQYAAVELTPRTSGSGPVYCGTDAWALIVALSSRSVPADLAKQLGWDSHRLIAAINDLRYQGVLEASFDRAPGDPDSDLRTDLPGPPPAPPTGAAALSVPQVDVAPPKLDIVPPPAPAAAAPAPAPASAPAPAPAAAEQGADALPPVPPPPPAPAAPSAPRPRHRRLARPRRRRRPLPPRPRRPDRSCRGTSARPRARPGPPPRRCRPCRRRPRRFPRSPSPVA